MTDEKKPSHLKEPDAEYPKNRRRHPRKKVRMSINYSCDGMAGEDRVRDISVGGIFIETTEEFYVGQVITISIPFTYLDRKIKIKGRVVRVSPDGIGIEFDRNFFDIE